MEYEFNGVTKTKTATTYLHVANDYNQEMAGGYVENTGMLFFCLKLKKISVG